MAEPGRRGVEKSSMRVDGSANGPLSTGVMTQWWYMSETLSYNVTAFCACGQIGISE
jgi:hypothetical protein